MRPRGALEQSRVSTFRLHISDARALRYGRPHPHMLMGGRDPQ